MMLLLVRHAHAGEKQRCPGPDNLRPLSAAPEAEAAGLLVRLEDYMKGSADVESLAPSASTSMPASAGGPWPGPTPAPATPIAISEYLGENDQFDRSITDFARRYADQNERDYQAFADAVRSGRLAVVEGL